MPTTSHRLFDFSPRALHCAAEVSKIQQFAEHPAFRSAAVEELVLQDGAFRYPLRPEDLAWIDFTRPPTEYAATQLKFLASQRLLFAINELKIARMPVAENDASAAASTAFYGERNQVLGAGVRPFLEDFAFDFLDNDGLAARIALDPVGYLRTFIEDDMRFWQLLVDRLVEVHGLDDGLRFILLQTGSLAPVKRGALAMAAAAGYFDLMPSANRPQLHLDLAGDDVVARLMRRSAIAGGGHAHWQFYLSTSLAGCNLLHSLASRPDRALYLYGAGFAAEAEWLAARAGMARVADHLAIANRGARGLGGEDAVNPLLNRFKTTLDAVVGRYGDRGLRHVSSGLAAASTLTASARRDLQEQLAWISALERYKAVARQIAVRIEEECPGIDRETFVEPREMCSTTHVHDDHRLVVIESGIMVLWGNAGMTMRLEPGDMVLIPQGRLHGSSIESDYCRYHQPIIPDAWINSLIAELDQK
jgi:mannose-6-phosphate isomerase-like protein (cupin superfamily)